MTTPPPAGEPQWVFPPKPKRQGGRVFLIVLLSAIVVAAAVGIIWFAMSQSADNPTPETPSATATASATPTPTPTASTKPVPTPTVTETPDPMPTVTEQPTTDPDVATFRDAVAPPLQDAATGLQMVIGTTGSAAINVIDPLIRDAQNLADREAPSSIANEWRGAIADYMSKLAALRTVAASNGDLTEAAAAAEVSLTQITELIGL